VIAVGTIDRRDPICYAREATLKGHERRSSGAHPTPSAPFEIVIDGELDAASAARLGEQVDDALEVGVGHVVVDLAGCPYADAASVGILLEAHRRVWRAGGRFALRAPSPRVLRLLRLSHLEQVFTIVPMGPDSPVATSGSA
jgi:anti-anti-sigma factor